MDYIIEINCVMDFIDNNIKSKIQLEQLSQISTFSIPHFYRLFKKYLKCSPMEYVVKRKLFFAAKELICNNYRIIDIAMEYGFESHDVFTRAFKRTYGINPEFFRRYGYCLPDFQFTLSENNNKENIVMHMVEIVTFPKTYLIGVENRIDKDEWAPDVFYKMYDKVFKNAPNRVHYDKEGYDPPYTYASHVISLVNADGSYNYFAGVEVSDFSDVPKDDGVVTRVIPEMMCAMIGYKSGLDFKEISSYLYGEWLEQNEYIPIIDRDITCYPIEWYSPSDFYIYEERIYMPIKPFCYDIQKREGYHGIFYREINSDRCKVKEPAFEVMFKWAKDNNLFDYNHINFEVRYGELADKKFYCEVFYKTEKALSEFINNYPVVNKEYPMGIYATTQVSHFYLEQCGRAFIRMLQKNQKYEVIGGCFEEYILNEDKLDMFTKINLYEGVKRN